MPGFVGLWILSRQAFARVFEKSARSSQEFWPFNSTRDRGHRRRILTTPQRLMPHRDSAARRRSHFLRPQFRQLLRGGERDNAPAIYGRDFSPPLPEFQEPSQTSHTIHLGGPR